MNSTDNSKRDFVKQFSSWMTEDGLVVDIYSGIKDLYKAVSRKDQDLAENAYYKTGMAFIKQQVEDRLGRFADNIMVEYSLVASTLDPDRPNKLQCCSFINSDKNDLTGFRQAISERYSLCIEKVSNQIGYSIYQHPHFLYDIPIEKDSTVWEHHKNARSKYILTKVTEGDSLIYDQIASDSDKDSPYLSIKGKDLSIGVFPLTRSYPEMVHSAQEWTKKNENNHSEAKSLKELQTILHQYCYTNISQRNSTIKSSYYISFPVFGAIASNQIPQYKVGNGSPLQGIGACFIYFEPKKDANINDDELHEQVSKLAYYVGDIIRFISVNYLFNLGLQLQERAKMESVKSAKAAIMSRNMSHNLGSHVMAYLKQQLGSVTSIMKEENKVLDNLIPESIKTDLKNYLECTINKSNPLEGKNGTHGFINKLKVLFKLKNNKNESANNTNLETVTSILECIDKWEPTKIENVEMPFLVGLGRFINYLQERQDYIATISTDYIPYGAPVNLKDAIYDELNPDLRYLRHKNESNNDAKNKPANILLNYIAKSEGISRENMKGDFVSEKDIRLGFVYYSSEGLKLFGLDTPNDNTQAAFESKNAALTQMRKINFSLPGGLVGRQAIFSIFENLIRNAAKHGDTTGVTNLDFTLDVIDGSDISWDVNHRVLNGMVNNPKVIQWESRVCDKIWRNLYEKAYDLDDIYLLTITDNLPCSEPVINKLKMGLYEDFVDFNTSQMTTANKGIKEVRISAAWIRGVTDEKCYLEYPKNRNSDMLLSIDSEYVDKDPNNKSKKLAPLVAVEMSDEGHLRYIVCVRKNKTVAIVSKVKTEIEGKEISIAFDAEALEMFMKLREEDKDRWTILSDDELINSKTSYSFILCPDDEIAFNAIRPYTSNRLCRWIVNEESKNALAGMDKEDKTLMYIYQLFTGLNEQNEDVFIEDERARTANNERERLEGKQHFYKIRFETDDNTSNKYLYRTHHATEKEYKGFYSQHINMGESYACVEGITGDNSSDRLVRREWLDERWYYTHLYALRKKVAIIDERLFKMVHNIDEKLFVSNSNEMIQTKELKNVHLEIDFENLKEQISQTIDNDELVESILSTKTIDELSEYVSEVPRNIFDNSQVDNSVMGECHLTPYFHGKAIDIYTVVKDAEGKMILVGCVKTEFNVKTNTFCNTFAKLATFMPDQDTGFALKPVSNEYKNLFANCYDYISIHQGILDKIYDNLGIKNSDSDKCRLTRCIHQSLMDDKKTIGDYLPRFIIHSGRAKPSREDMPQLQPFVQYAAIENAVKDCKSMLVELLDFAKYEPANN